MTGFSSWFKTETDFARTNTPVVQSGFTFYQAIKNFHGNGHFLLLPQCFYRIRNSNYHLGTSYFDLVEFKSLLFGIQLKPSYK